MPNIKITYDKELDKRISKDERDSLKRLFVANAKEVVKTDRNLKYIDGPTQVTPMPDEVVVDNSSTTDSTPTETVRRESEKPNAPGSGSTR